LQKIEEWGTMLVCGRNQLMADFQWQHFRGEIILDCVRWYRKYGISYRELEEMMVERGVIVDHTTRYRWVQQYAPDIEKRL
jgi:transposase-like protein